MRSNRLTASRYRSELLEPRRLLALTGPLFAGQVPLLPGSDTTYSTNLTTGDFDGDGRIDIVVSRLSPDALMLLRGDGKGGYGTPTTLTSDAANDVTAADFNGDGHLDLAIGGTASKVLLNAGDGTFGNAITVDLGPTVKAIHAADFDGDGRMDLAATNQASDRALTVAFNLGNGTFGNGIPLGASRQVSTSVSSVVVDYTVAADFTGDGRIDLATLATNSTTSSTATIFPSQAGRAFASAPIVVEVGPSASALVAADFNSDGRADLVALQGRSGFGSAAIVLSQPGGGFSAPTTLAETGSTTLIRSADVDKDGNADLVALTTSTRAILLGDGSGTLANVSERTLSTYLGRFELSDLDGDRLPEIVGLGGISSSVVVLRATGGGKYETPPTYQTSNAVNAQVNADFNGDGHIDIATTGMDPDGAVTQTVTLMLGDGSGGFGPPRLLDLSAWMHNSIDAADLNHDAKVDLLVGNSSGLWLMMGHGDGTFENARKITSAYAGSAGTFAVDDFDSDGQLDVVVGNQLLLGVGDGTFKASLTIAGLTNGVAYSRADFNHDGRTDLALFTAGQGIPVAYRAIGFQIMLNTGGGTFSKPGNLFFTGTGLKSLAIADFDHDGNLDVVAGNSAVQFFRGRGDGMFDRVIFKDISPSPSFLVDSIVIEDLDQDGDADIAASYYGSVYLFPNNGDATFGNVQTVPLSRGYRYLSTADFNEDGKPDLATGSVGDAPNSFGIAILLNRGVAPAVVPTLVSSSLEFDAGPAVVFQFDRAIAADSVGVADLLVTNLTNGQTASAATSVTVSADGKSVRFLLPTNLSNGDYRFELAAGSVSAATGAALASAVRLEGPSVFLLAGDVNHDRAVNFADLLTLAKNYGQAGRTFAQGNVDYSADGSVSFSDLLILAKAYNTSLPPATVATAASSASLSRKRTAVAASVLA